METACILALCVSGLSLLLAAFSYRRAAGARDAEATRAKLARDVEALRVRQRLLAEQIARRLRGGYEDSLARLERAEARLAELRESVSAETRNAIDALRAQLVEARQKIEANLQRLKSDVSTRAETAQEAMHKRIQRMEGRIQLLMARADIARAERLADRDDFLHAEDVLQEAVTKVREVKLALSDVFAEDPAFREVLLKLQLAIRAVRTKAADHQREIDHALSASDALLASLEGREQTMV